MQISLLLLSLVLSGIHCQWGFNPYNMQGRAAAATSNGNPYQQYQYGTGGAAAAAASNGNHYQQYQQGTGGAAASYGNPYQQYQQGTGGAAAAAATSNGNPYQQYQYGIQQKQMPWMQQYQQQQQPFMGMGQQPFMGGGGMSSILNFANQMGGQAMQNPNQYNIIGQGQQGQSQQGLGQQDSSSQILSSLDSSFGQDSSDEQEPDYSDLEDSSSSGKKVIASAQATAINGYNQNQFNADPNIPQFNSNQNTVLSKTKINQEISPTFNDNKSLQQSVQQNAYIGNNYIYKEIKNQIAPGPPNVYGDGGIYQKLYGEGGLYSTLYAGYQAPQLPSDKPC